MAQIVGASELITKQDCSYNSEQCYKTNIKPIMEELKEIKKDVKALLIATTSFRERLRPLEKIVYGMAGGILFAVLMALIYSVVKK